MPPITVTHMPSIIYYVNNKALSRHVGAFPPYTSITDQNPLAWTNKDCYPKGTVNCLRAKSRWLILKIVLLFSYSDILVKKISRSWLVLNSKTFNYIFLAKFILIILFNKFIAVLSISTFSTIFGTFFLL